MNNVNNSIPVGVSFEYFTLEESIEFFCARCGKRKVAKKYAQFTDKGSTKKVCNGCYGNLMSKVNQKK